jgi:hypothetical protein
MSRRSGDGHTPGEHSLHGFTVDGLALAASSVAHGAVGDTVDVAQSTGGVLVCVFRRWRSPISRHDDRRVQA